jgi:hypothetical protein
MRIPMKVQIVASCHFHVKLLNKLRARSLLYHKPDVTKLFKSMDGWNKGRIDIGGRTTSATSCRTWSTTRTADKRCLANVAADLADLAMIHMSFLVLFQALMSLKNLCTAHQKRWSEDIKVARGMWDGSVICESSAFLKRQHRRHWPVMSMPRQ